MRRMLAGLPVTERRLDLAGTATAVRRGRRRPAAGPPARRDRVRRADLGARRRPRSPSATASSCPTCPGSGESEPVDRLDPATFAAWFSALLRMTCDQPPALVAHSLGGSLAARFATEHGELLERLVDLRRARRRAVPDAAGPARDGDPVRAAPVRAQRGAVRAPGVLRPRPRAPARTRRGSHAFGADTLARARVPHVKRTMRRLIALGTKPVPGPGAAHRGPDHAAVGPARPLRPARPRRGGERPAGLAAACRRRRRATSRTSSNPTPSWRHWHERLGRDRGRLRPHEHAVADVARQRGPPPRRAAPGDALPRRRGRQRRAQHPGGAPRRPRARDRPLAGDARAARARAPARRG